jgi:hypothetical protein
VLETWASPEALGVHVAAPHMAAYGKKTRDLIASRAIHVLSAIDYGRVAGRRRMPRNPRALQEKLY